MVKQAKPGPVVRDQCHLGTGVWEHAELVIHKVYFRYSAPRLRAELMADNTSIALLRMDGEMYESTTDIQSNLNDLVTVKGCVIVDDWNIPVCRRAIEEFRHRHNVFDEIVPVDDRAVYWCKSNARALDHAWYAYFNAPRTAE